MIWVQTRVVTSYATGYVNIAGIRGNMFSICNVHFHSVESVSSLISEFHTENVGSPFVQVSERRAKLRSLNSVSEGLVPFISSKIDGLLSHESRPCRISAGRRGRIFALDSSDWSNGLRYHNFDTRPDTELFDLAGKSTMAEISEIRFKTVCPYKPRIARGLRLNFLANCRKTPIDQLAYMRRQI